MASFKPTFTPVPQLPNLYFPPNKGIVLGTVLTKTRNPREPLKQQPAAAIDASVITKDQTPRPWSWTSDNHISGGASIWAKLSMTPIGGEVGGHGGNDNAITIKSDAVTTEYFSPDVEYLKKVVAHPEVKPVLEKWGRPAVYMVVSLMVADGAVFEVTKGNRKGFKTEISADGTGAGVPANAGVGGHFDKANTNTVSSTLKDPFVLAYQLLEVKGKKDGSATSQPDNKYALFDDSDPGSQDFLESWEANIVSPEQMWTEES